MVLTKIPINSNTLIPASQGHQAFTRDPELSSAPTRLPSHCVLMTPQQPLVNPLGWHVAGLLLSSATLGLGEYFLL